MSKKRKSAEVQGVVEAEPAAVALQHATTDLAGLKVSLPTRAEVTGDEWGSRLRAIEDDLLERTTQVLRDAMSFRDVDPEQQAVPAEWVEELGIEEATKRYRLARSAWQPAQSSPAGLQLAKSLLTGILKNKSDQATVRELNVAVQMVVNQAAFPEKEVT